MENQNIYKDAFKELIQMRVLIIDDNRNITDMLSKYLNLKGVDAVVANDGKKGLELLENEKFDATLLDIAMPEFSGYDVIDTLEKKGRLKDNRIIILTATSITDEQISDLTKRGVHTVLKKPITLSHLLQILTEQ